MFVAMTSLKSCRLIMDRPCHKDHLKQFVLTARTSRWALHAAPMGARISCVPSRTPVAASPRALHHEELRRHSLEVVRVRPGIVRQRGPYAVEDTSPVGGSDLANQFAPAGDDVQPQRVEGVEKTGLGTGHPWNSPSRSRAHTCLTASSCSARRGWSRGRPGRPSGS